MPAGLLVVLLALGGALLLRSIPGTDPVEPLGPIPDAGTVPPTATGTPGPGAPPVGLDVRSVGARGDGVTDDAPAIRDALAASDAVYIPAGTYLLDSYLTPRTQIIDADFMFALRDGQSIVAAPGAVFRVADGILTSSTADWGGNVFLADRVQGVSVTGLTLDLNGGANLVPPGRTITGYGMYLNDVRQVVVDGVTMRDTPGQNYIVAQSGGSDIAVTDSTFLNGGTSLPDNRNQTDFSALYFTATRVQVDGVMIDHEEEPFDYSGGVELHGSDESVTNSSIHRSWPAVYIGPDDYSGLAVMQNTTVTHNEFIDCPRGVIFNAGGVGDIDQVDITKNVFRLSDSTAFPGEPARAIDQDRPSDGRWTYHHIITGLRITSNDFYIDAQVSDAVIRLSQVHSAVIEDNRVHDSPGGVLVLGSSPWGTSDVTFRNNQVALRSSPSAPAIALAFDDSSVQPPVDAFTVTGVSISGNTFELADQTPQACGVYLDWGTGAPVSDIDIRDTTLVNVGQLACGPQAGSLAVD